MGPLVGSLYWYVNHGELKEQSQLQQLLPDMIAIAIYMKSLSRDSEEQHKTYYQVKDEDLLGMGFRVPPHDGSLPIETLGASASRTCPVWNWTALALSLHAIIRTL